MCAVKLLKPNREARLGVWAFESRFGTKGGKDSDQFGGMKEI